MREPVSFLLSWAMLASALCASPAYCAAPEHTEARGWLIGAGHMWAPDPFVADAPSVNETIPLLGYRGERVTWLGPYLSYEFVEHNSLSVSAVIEARFEGIAEDIDEGPLAGVRKRDSALEAGADVTYGPITGSVRKDVSRRHNGYELSLALQEQRQIGKAWLIEGRLGAAWQSAALTSHLYGVDTHEAGPGLEAYEPEAALNYEASLLASHQMGVHWMALASLVVRRLDDTIVASPLVDRRHDVGGFLAIVYRFGPAGDAP